MFNISCYSVFNKFKDTINLSVIDDYYHWINERNNLFINRFFKKSSSLTDDPLLLSGKFTNIYRELDRGTLHYLVNMVPSFNNEEELLINTILYKCYNLISAQKTIGKIEFIDGKIQDDMKSLSNKFSMCESVFTTAHLFYSMSNHKLTESELEIFGKDVKYNRLVKALFNVTLPILSSKIKEYKEAKSLLDVFNISLGIIPGSGPFIAYEIAVHLCMANSKTHFLNDSVSLDDWFNIGPGPHNFLTYLLGVDSYTVKESELREIVTALYSEQENYKKLFFMPKLNLLNIENGCCEVSKYLRVKQNLGRFRNYFKLSNENNLSYISLLKSFLSLYPNHYISHYIKELEGQYGKL